jgi:dTDP-4-amino-4,6-dideoxygalactose transaminase
MAWDLALQPVVFRALSAIPRLGIGATPFEPDFDRGGIDGASLVLTDLALDGFAAAADRRAARAERLATDLEERTRFEPITAAAGERAVYPRLAVRAPDPSARAAALEALGRIGAGASPYYPSALSRLEALRPHLVADAPMPGAESLAARLLTLPVHGRLEGRLWNEALTALEAI